MCRKYRYICDEYVYMGKVCMWGMETGQKKCFIISIIKFKIRCSQEEVAKKNTPYKKEGG